MQTYREKKEKRKYSKTHHVPVLEFPMNITSEKWLMATSVSHSVIFQTLNIQSNEGQHVRKVQKKLKENVQNF